MVIDTLTAVFNIDAKGFHSGMARVQDSLTNTRRKFAQTSRQMASGFGNVVRATAKVSAAITGMAAAGSLATFSLAKMVAEVDSLRRGLDFATGSAEKGANAFAFLIRETDRLGISTSVAIEQFKNMAAAAKGTTLEGEGVRNLFLSVAEASAVLGLSTERTSLVFQALQQMIAKGRITAEELRQQLGESLPMAMQAMARAVGVGTGELNKMMEAGGLISTKVLPKFADQLRREVAPSVISATSSMRAELERLSNAWFMMKVEFQEAKISDELKQGIVWLSSMVRALPKFVMLFVRSLFVVKKVLTDTIALFLPFKETMKGLEVSGKLVAKSFVVIGEQMSKVFNLFKRINTSANEATKSSSRFVGLLGGMISTRGRKKTIPDVVSQAAKRATTEVDTLKKKLDEISITTAPQVAGGVEESEFTINTSAAQKEMNDLLSSFDSKFKALDIQLKAEINRADVEAGVLSVNNLVDSMTQQRLIRLEEYYATNKRLLVDSSEEEIALTQKYLALKEKIVIAGDTKLEQERASILEATRAQFEENFQDRFGLVMDTVSNATRRVSQTIVDFSLGAKVSFSDLFKSVIADLQKMVFEIAVVEPIIAKFGEFLRSSFSASPSAGGTGLMGVLGPILSGVKSVFGFAKGGIINEPVAGVGLNSGAGYTIGEQGPEMVTPLGDFVKKIKPVAVNIENTQVATPQAAGGLDRSAQKQPTNVNITINAVDSKSVLELMKQNPQAVVAPIIESLQVGDRGLTAALRGAF